MKVINPQIEKSQETPSIKKHEEKWFQGTSYSNYFKTSNREECEKQPQKKTHCVYENEAQDDSRFFLENSVSQAAVEEHLQSNERKRKLSTQNSFLGKNISQKQRHYKIFFRHIES